MSGVHQFVQIGEHAMLGGLSRLVQDLPPYVIAAGNDVLPHGLNVKGLSRRGFSDETILALRKAYKLLYKSDLTLEEAKKGVIGQNYNIGSGVVLNNIEIAKKIISSFKKINNNINIKSKINLVKDRPGHDLRYCLDSSKLRNNLKWRCKSSFNQRINETIIWYINKFRANYFKNKDYKYRIGLKA